MHRDGIQYGEFAQPHTGDISMRRTLKGTAACIAAAIVTMSAPHAADSLVDTKSIPGTFSANVGLFSEYYFRGVSQTDDAPALQGGMDWAELGCRRHLLHISGCEPVAELRFHRRAGGAVTRFRIRIGNREPELFARQLRRLRRCLRHGAVERFTIILRLNHRSSPGAPVFIYPDTSTTEGTGA